MGRFWAWILPEESARISWKPFPCGETGECHVPVHLPPESSGGSPGEGPGAPGGPGQEDPRQQDPQAPAPQVGQEDAIGVILQGQPVCLPPDSTHSPQ